MELKYTEEQVLDELKKARSRIPSLIFHGSYQAASTGPIIEGCRICTEMKSMSFVMGYRCNAECDFCFAPCYVWPKYDEDEKYNRSACFKEFKRNKDNIDGIGLSGGETLIYLDEIKDYVNKIREEKQNIYFWVYTNGIEANKQNLKVLKDLGVEEIRFNLAASDYSPAVINKLGIARELFKYVAVEVPSYPEQKDKLINNLGKMQYHKIDQLNLQELLINNNNFDKIKGEIYQSGIMFAKKYFLYGSRKLTYEIIETCLDRGYSFTVNDCSASRFGRIE
ncbi:MAG: radical SAM protein [Actinobacteria bacterium]|nr:radical SAM protein [Actinomycetota bacterium]